MDEVVITLRLEGAEYASSDESEVVARWLHELARRIKQHGLERVTKVLDVNGNAVGTVQ